jgi:hypothetical protein
MGQGTAEAVEEIEQVRRRLDAEVEVLQERLPVVAVWTKRAVGGAIGGGFGAIALWLVVRRVRKRRRQRRGHGLPAAVAIVPLTDSEVHRLPDPKVAPAKVVKAVRSMMPAVS